MITSRSSIPHPLTKLDTGAPNTTRSEVIAAVPATKAFAWSKSTSVIFDLEKDRDVCVYHRTHFTKSFMLRDLKIYKDS